MDREENVTAAALLAVSDHLRAAIEAAAGRAGGGAGALTALHAWADGEPIEALAAGIGLSHSRAVRVIDRLAGDGLVARRPDPADGRRALIGLTPAGRDTAMRILRAREQEIDRALAPLDEAQRAALADASSAILGGLVDGRAAARITCRFCDTLACGHETGTCPATRAADLIESRARG